MKNSANSVVAELAHTVIRASAGSGKTHRLSSRYLWLIDHDQPVDRILATTFTRKAAGEILDRIFQRLSEAAICEKTRRQLALDLDRRELPVERCQAMLAQLTKNMHRMRVATLDAFFGQVARALSLELGLPADWQILDELDDKRVRQIALGELLEREPRQAVELVHLLAKGEAQRNILEMLQNTTREVYALFQETRDLGPSPWNWIKPAPRLGSETLNEKKTAFGNTEMWNKRSQDAHAAAIEALETEDWETFVQKGLAKKILGDGLYYRKEIPAEVVAVYRPIIDHARAELLDRIIRQTDGAYKLAKAFDDAYEEGKREAAAILFDDVPRRLCRISHNTRTTQMRYRLDTQIDHLLLDEFQDTSISQWEALRPLARSITQSLPKQRSFFCVGDTKQAIYGWRGGQSEILASLDRHLDQLQSESLNASRRSSPEVIDGVNQVFLNRLDHSELDDHRPGFASWDFRRHETMRTEMGYVCLEAAPKGESGEPVSPAVRTAELVRNLHERAPDRSIGILVRKNQSVTEIMFALRQEKITASEEGGNPLTDSAAVLHVLAALQFVEHPHDSVARFHFGTGPLGAHWQVTPIKGEAEANRTTGLVQQLRRDLVEKGYGRCIADWASQLFPHCSSRESLRLSQLIEMAFTYDARSTLRPRDFIRYVESQRVADPTSASIRVMTIHQSKGLEFDAVVLPSLEEPFRRPTNFLVSRDPLTLKPRRICRYVSKDLRNLFSETFQEIYLEDMQRGSHEYLSSLYVAMTRARFALHMIVEPTTSSKYKKTTAGLLLATLAKSPKAEAGEILFEKGDPEWFCHQVPAKPQSATATPRRRLQLEKRGTHSSRQPTAVAASRRQDVRNAHRFFESGDRQAPLRGTLFHQWMAKIDWIDDRGLPSPASLKAMAAGSELGEADIEPLISLVKRTLSSSPIQELFRKADYEKEFQIWLEKQKNGARPLGTFDRLVVRSEQPIQFMQQARLGQGSIDRLVLAYHGDSLVAAEIIDFKTDEALISERDAVKKYRGQLETYRTAVHQMLLLPPESIRLRLVFVVQQKIIDVD